MQISVDRQEFSSPANMQRPLTSLISLSQNLTDEDMKAMAHKWQNALCDYLPGATPMEWQLVRQHGVSLDDIFPKARLDWGASRASKDKMKELVERVYKFTPLMEKLTGWGTNCVCPIEFFELTRRQGFMPTQIIMGSFALLVKVQCFTNSLSDGQASSQTSSTYDMIARLFERMDLFLGRYKMTIATSAVTKPLAETFLQMMIEILKFCAIARKYIRRGVFGMPPTHVENLMRNRDIRS
jgi:hypothetical protein